MAGTPRTAREVDADLIRTTDAYRACIDQLDDAGAMVLLDDINELLDERIRIPLQRLPSDRDGHTSPRATG